MSNPSFVDRYRWWLFVGAFAVNTLFVVLKYAMPAFEGAYAVVNVLSVIPLAAGIYGFVTHARRRRWEQADKDYRESQSEQERP